VHGLLTSKKRDKNSGGCNPPSSATTGKSERAPAPYLSFKQDEIDQYRVKKLARRHDRPPE
jgi:hypothetical protein